MSLFNNKYRIENSRLKTWDYSSIALYFITVCTLKKEHFFGEIEGDKMILNDVGIIAQDEWIRTPSIRPDTNLSLQEFVIMPNHFHAIIGIGENEFNTIDKNSNNGRDGKHPVSTVVKLPVFASIDLSISASGDAINKFGPQSKNLRSVVRGFKSSVTIQARKIMTDFGWQPRYHDHIIRGRESHLRIRQYISNNPKHWNEDKFYTE